MTFAELVKSNSTLPSGTLIAHLQNQAGGGVPGVVYVQALDVEIDGAFDVEIEDGALEIEIDGPLEIEVVSDE